MSMFPPARIGTDTAVAALSGWQAVAMRDAIEKRFRFPNFNAAFGAVAPICAAASSMNCAMRTSSSVTPPASCVVNMTSTRL